jgi:hypothetical protein
MLLKFSDFLASKSFRIFLKDKGDFTYQCGYVWSVFFAFFCTLLVYTAYFSFVGHLVWHWYNLANTIFYYNFATNLPFAEINPNIIKYNSFISNIFSLSICLSVISLVTYSIYDRGVLFNSILKQTNIIESKISNAFEWCLSKFCKKLEPKA